MVRFFAVVLVTVSLFSCAVSKALYLGSNNYSPGAGSPPDSKFYNKENINGDFPDAVYIKTRTQSFNSYHYYLLNSGLIWHKSIDLAKEPKEWTLFLGTGFPNSAKTGFNEPKAIAEISADADELTVLCTRGNIYSYCFDKTMAMRSNAWLDKQGWPTPEQFHFDKRTAKNLSWALGKRNNQVLYYEDIFGNQHHNGTMEIATFYVLLEDGQEICYGDPGLPCDFSRNFSGPQRGTFKSVSMSASASTMFVINDAGEMYTRLVDYDTVGCDPMFFKYTYIPYTSDLPGTNYFSNLNEWALPAEDWFCQPRIPLYGKAAVSRHITILQNGHGNSARELRVAGLNDAGETGYWSKQIFDDVWKFIGVPLFFDKDAVLVTSESFDINREGERGKSMDREFSGFRWNVSSEKNSAKTSYGNVYEIENEWEYRIGNFNILEGDCDFYIDWQQETCVMKLHPLEMWTYVKRDYLPGRTGAPKIFLATLDIPQKAFDSLSGGFSRQLKEKFAKNDKALFHYTIAASGNYLIIRETGGSWLLFLTDGTISNHYSEIHAGSHIQNYEEARRYFSAELTLNEETVLSNEVIARKISLNREFAQELKYKIRELKWSQLTAFKFSAGYIPAHYIAKITPLRFIDVPKVRTMTSFGEKLVLANNAYINAITDSRIRVYEKILEMLETRLLFYSDLQKEKPPFAISPWYSDNISDYWQIAGLPQTIAGNFYIPASGKKREMIFCDISFVPMPSDMNISGWYLKAADSDGFTFFLESRSCAKTVYSRKGKSPQEKTVKLECTLFINNSAGTEAEREIIEKCISPFLETGANDGINVRVIYDGKTFEIREYPSKRNDSLLFKGQSRF